MWGMETLQKRFWAKVKKTDGCWLWKGAKDRNGYGVMSYGPKKGRTHPCKRGTAVSWYLTHGEWPQKGKGVHHRCDTPACIRPDHLWVGTQAENIQDMASKGRHVGRRKLTDDQVRKIVYLYEVVGGHTHTSLAALFGITRRGIGRVLSGVRRRHVCP